MQRDVVAITIRRAGKSRKRSFVQLASMDVSHEGIALPTETFEGVSYSRAKQTSSAWSAFRRVHARPNSPWRASANTRSVRSYASHGPVCGKPRSLTPVWSCASAWSGSPIAHFPNARTIPAESSSTGVPCALLRVAWSSARASVAAGRSEEVICAGRGGGRTGSAALDGGPDGVRALASKQRRVRSQ